MFKPFFFYLFAAKQQKYRILPHASVKILQTNRNEKLLNAEKKGASHTKHRKGSERRKMSRSVWLFH